MPATSLTQLARDHLRIAHQSTSGRSASTVFGGREHHLRQTLIAIVGGRALDDHESPGEATLHILRGRVRLIDDTEPLDGVSGDILPIPRARHRLEAIEDSVVLLTVAQLP
jgi:quercetin dioxygenase-like cupin family protein